MNDLKINFNVLFGVVNDYLIGEEEYKLFLRTWTGGWWHDKNEEQRENYTKFYERSTLRCEMVVTMCKLIGADVNSVLAIAKAINRWEKHGGKWDREYCIHVGLHDEKIMKFISPDDGWGTRYYTSIGRRISA